MATPSAPSAALVAALDVARKAAEERIHALVTPEHLLLGILSGNEGAAIVSACGADPADMMRELGEYLDLLPSGRPRAAQLSNALAALLELTSRVVQLGGGGELGIGRVLAALSGIRKSYAAMLLYSAGIDRIDLLRVIAHGTPKTAPIAPAGDWLTVRVYNDDYTSMEFVAYVLELVFRFSAAKAQDRMLEIHRTGMADIATLKRAEAIDRALDLAEQAAQAGFPLRCTLETAE